MSHRRLFGLPVLMSALALMFGLLVAPAAQAATPGSVSGTVTGPGGAPLVGGPSMTVQVQWWHDVDGGHWDSEDSVYLSAGQVAYTLGDLSAGKYRIVVFPSGTAYARAYSSAFMVADGQAVTGMKVALSAPATLSVTISAPGGSALPNTQSFAIDIQRFDTEEKYWDSEEDENLLAGQFAFSVGNLPAGTYRIVLWDSSGRTYRTSYSPVFTLSPGQAKTGVVVTAQTELVTNIAAPVISGQASVGSLLSASPGVWSPQGISYSYQWLRRGAPIAGATAPSYRVTKKDLGAPLAVRVTADMVGELPATANSAATAPVTRGTKTAVKATGAKKKATFKVTVTSKGVKASKIKGKVAVSLNGKQIKTATVKNGKATVVVTKQKKGAKAYTVTYLGKGSLGASAKTVKVKVK
jgi:hypothetical protein